MASRLNRGWPPGPSWLVTCWPSMFSWYSRTSPRSCTGTLPIAVVRLPGAISASDVQSRPCTGSSDICSGSMLDPIVDWVTLMSGASPVTVTLSATPVTVICMSSAAVCPTSSVTPAARDGRETGEFRGDAVGTNPGGQCERRRARR